MFLLLLPVLLAASGPQAAAPVQLDILVIEAKKGGKPHMPAKLKEVKVDDDLRNLGFTSARILDQLPAKVEHMGSVSLEINTPYSKKKEMLSVTVLGQTKSVVTLRVELPSLKFKTETGHKKGATLMLVPRQKGNSALFLAIRPKP